jgi:LuxR family maltose regulon positive regulatory protein
VAVYEALALCDTDHVEEHRALAAATARETGLKPAWATIDRPDEPATTHPLAALDAVATGVETEAAPVRIRLLGGFGIAIHGRELDLGSVKPRPRAILRFLALNAGQPVHREVLETTFWPDADPATAARNVHVALSGLRRLFCASGDADCQVLVRDGEAYRLVLPTGSRVDLLDVERSLGLASAVRRGGGRDTGGRDAAISELRAALRAGAAQLLPEDGPADWVVDRREQLRTELAAAARLVAESVLDADPGSAAETCAAGLRVDPTDDALWKLLIAARERSGDPAAAQAARQGYRRLLAQLGLADGVTAGALTAGPGTRPR